jgi:hypothetical protein
MAPVVPSDPQSAIDYDDRTTAAVKAVLVTLVTSTDAVTFGTPTSITKYDGERSA